MINAISRYKEIIKVSIIKSGGLDVLTNFCHSDDNEISHQGFGIVGNIAEKNQSILLENDIPYDLKFFPCTFYFNRYSSQSRESDCKYFCGIYSYDSNC